MSQGSGGDDRGPRKSPVGYGRPPVEHRFKKGVSGNPRGRPKKRRAPARAVEISLEGLVLREAYRSVQVRENDRLIEMPAIQAVLRSLHVAAVKGDRRSQIAVAGFVQAIEERALQDRMSLTRAMIDHKFGWEEVFEECDREGRPRPDILPHPHDIAIDSRNGEVIFNGPFDAREKAGWDKMLAHKKEALEENDYLRRRLKRSKQSPDTYDQLIASNQRIIDLVDRTFPDEKTRRAADFDIRQWRERQAEIQKMRERWRKERTRGQTDDVQGDRRP